MSLGFLLRVKWVKTHLNVCSVGTFGLSDGLSKVKTGLVLYIQVKIKKRLNFVLPVKDRIVHVS